MGTKVKVENYLPGHYSMRDFSRESNGASGPSCYTDGSFPNGQFNHGFVPRTIPTSHPGYDMDVMKQTMLQQDATFKDQVLELHRLHSVQSGLMDDARRNGQLKRRAPYETSSSSSPLPSQMQSKDAQRWNVSSFPLANLASGRPLISGADTVQLSPDSANGKSIWAGPSSFHNSYIPKNSDVSEFRSTKHRKQMLDLRLPGDEYIGTGEVGGNPASANGNMFLNYPGKMECPGDAQRFDLNISKSKELADLNEPLQEEKPAYSSVGFLRHTGSHSGVPYTDLPERLSSSSKDTPQTSNKGSSLNGTLNNLHDIRANGQDWFRYALESERYKASATYINQETHSEKAPVPSQPVHVRLDQVCQPPPFLTSQHINGEPWKTKSLGITENYDRSYSMSNSNIGQQSISGFHPLSQPGLFHPSHLGNSWNPPATSWRNPNFLSQQPISLHPSPSPFRSTVNLSKSAQPSTQSNDLFGKWNLNSGPGANVAFGSEPPLRNGYSQGSSSAYNNQAARIPPSDFDHVNRNYSENTSHKGNNFLKAISCNDVNPVNELNLNVAQRLPNWLSDDYINPQISKIVDKNCKPNDPLAVLPWLRGKGGCSNGSGSSSEVGNKAKMLDSSRKIFGVSIFENPTMPKDPPNVHPQSGYKEIECRKGKGVFDMNVSCEVSDSEADNMPVDEVVVTKKETKSESFINHFDLNSCITEEEETPCVKAGTGIDLEALINLENEDVILPVDDGDAVPIKSAALALVAISSCVNSTQSSTEENTCLPPPEGEGDDPLQWFVSIACCNGKDVDTQMVGSDRLLKGLDDFESMVLKQKECSPEEYLPKLSIPDFRSIDNVASTLTTRPRKGKGHRGRQKWDFQRDVLPGVITLSRHEVTEDLQMFTGLMKAAGHSWEPGPSRRNAARNGRGRGRRRSVAATPLLSDAVCALPLTQQQVQSNNAQVCAAGRSLTTGWGKTTRRPRRQRCPAGNSALPVTLT